MTEVQEFLATAVQAVNKADQALHNGDPEPRLALWSTEPPVTLFGAALGSNQSGRPDVEAFFRVLATRFRDGQYFDVDIVAADVRGDLAYTVAFENSAVSLDGGPVTPTRLRVTQIYRREDGEWRVVHRHGDHDQAFDAAAAAAERADR